MALHGLFNLSFVVVASVSAGARRSAAARAGGTKEVRRLRRVLPGTFETRDDAHQSPDG